MSGGGKVKGTRIYPDKDGLLMFPPDTFCYGKDGEGRWLFKHPDTHTGMLTGHTVEEHKDGTITVTPSILQSVRGASDMEGAVHGYLTKGEWIDC